MTTPTENPFTGHERGSREYTRLLVALFAAGVATFAQLYSPQAVLPLMASDLRLTEAQAALSVSAATLGLAAAVLPWSWVADRIGRVRAMGASVVAATVLGLTVPLLPTYGLILAVRFVEGVALAGLPALAVAYLTEEVHRLHVPAAAGTYVAGTSLGGLLGRLVSGPLAEVTSWRVGVLAVSVLAAVAAGLFLWLAPASRGFRPTPRGTGPSLWWTVRGHLRRPDLLALFAQGFLLMGGFVAVYNYLGFRLEAPPFGLSQAVVSLLFLAYLAGTVSSRRAGLLVGRLGRLPVLLGSVAVMIAGVLLTLAGTVAVVLVGLVVLTAGFFGAHSVASGWVGQRAVVGKAQATSLYNLFYYAGSSLVGWVGGYAYGGAGWGGLVGLVVALAVVAAVAAAAALRTPPPTSTPTPPPIPSR